MLTPNVIDADILGQAQINTIRDRLVAQFKAGFATEADRATYLADQILFTDLCRVRTDIFMLLEQ